MYFWTNTPDQAKFISLCAEVNKLNAYINDPNVSEAQAQIHQVQFIAAKAKMALQFLIVVSDWDSWLVDNILDTPQLSKSGVITVSRLDGLQESLRLQPPDGYQTIQGEVYYWKDFFRMLALQAFLLRSSPGAEHAQYHPESYFNE